MTFIPSGEERDVQQVLGAAIDGAPLAYIVVLSAVVGVLAFIPFSVVIGAGKGFPLSQGIYPLVGWLLGPIAGAVANGIGALIGVIFAPHNTTLPAATILSAMVGGFASGVMRRTEARRRWWMALAPILVMLYALYAGRAILQIGVQWWLVVWGSVINWSALLLFLLPTRTMFARWISSPDLKRVTLGLFLGTWTVAGLAHLVAASIIYLVSNWPNEVWLTMAPMAPVEHTVRSLIGAVIGTGVIAGLRAIGLVKPREATY
jgi:hypothetical protein